jgi:malonate decarboxylase alpha subunit
MKRSMTLRAWVSYRNNGGSKVIRSSSASRQIFIKEEVFSRNVAMGNQRWASISENTERRLNRGKMVLGYDDKVIKEPDTVRLLESIIEPYDKVCIEGNNQKQASFLAESLSKVNPEKIYGLHMIQSVVNLPAHMELFRKKIAAKLDFSYSAIPAKEIADLVVKGRIQLGAIHTYLELYARYFVDLTPRVSLVAADCADPQGNLYTGPNTEDTPVIVEATKFGKGIVVAQVNCLSNSVPRVDIPGDWVDFIIEAPEPYYLEPLFTRDPARITDKSVLMAMMAIKGIYGPYGVKSLNHGIGYDTAAIELLLPTYANELGLKGNICTHWVLNPHPTLIPAIEMGFVQSIYCFGSEVGMEDYVKSRSDIFFVGLDGSLRSNRAFAQVAGHYAADMFIGSTLQIDPYGNSSTATLERISGFGGAPNMGTNAGGRRHFSPAWGEVGKDCPMNLLINGQTPSGKKLVVQIVESCKKPESPTFVEKLDAWELAEKAHLPLPPIMIYGSDLTHIVTDIGVAYLHKCTDLEERKAAICSVAGKSPLGSLVNAEKIAELRERKIVQYPEDLSIKVADASRGLLAAKSMKELVEWSSGLYKPPAKFLHN